MLKNIKEIHPEASELDGYENIGEENQAKIDTAWEEGHVADEDIPESARKKPDSGEEDVDAGEDGEKKKKTAPKKRAPPKKKVMSLSPFWSHISR